MKLPAILLLCVSAPLVFGQTFVTGQAARAEIGQFSFSRGDTTASGQILGGVGGLAWANGTLFVADDNRVGATPNNNRVMMFNTSQIPAPHDDLSSISPFNSYCALCGYPAFNVIGQTSMNAAPITTTNPQGIPVPGRTASQVSNATAVATDGTVVAIADTDNNRVLIYNSVPATAGASANVVLGQPDFTTLQTPSTTSSSLRGPQGVWIAGGKLFVADTQNSRVLIWNHIPTANNQPADIVLGQPNFTSDNQPPPNGSNPPVYPTAAANQLLNPTSVSTDPSGTHLFVSDLGFNRVLIWNSIPTSNDQPADVVVGQPNMTSTIANNTNNLCSSPGNDSTGKPIYPSECNKTLNFPRYALSDGTHLFIADGGNDRVLVFNSVPTQNGAGADAVLGQPDFYGDVVASGMATFGSTAVDNTGSVDTVQNPTSLAWDGTNLYVSDPYDRRVLLFSPIGPGDSTLPNKSILNAASRILRQEGFVTLSLTGSITANDTVTITIAGTNYTYTVKSSDTLATITQGLISAINSSNSNAGDPNAFALAGAIPNTIYLSAKNPNASTDATSLAASTSNTSNLAATASGSYLTGGTSATVAPGTLIEIDGTNLADSTQNANPTATLPTSLGGVQVYIDGFLSPIMSISPNQVITQVPFTFTDRSSASVYVRTAHNNGQVGVTNAAPIVIVPANPGLFGEAGSEPRPAFQAMHSPTNASDVVSVDGTVQAGDVATITIAGTAYSYTVLASDSLTSIAQGLISKINSGPDPNVTASVGGAFARVVLTAKSSDPTKANGISITTNVTAASGKSSAGVTLTAYNPTTCCMNSNSGPINATNPAEPGETITLLATGLGIIQDSNGNLISAAVAGQPYSGPAPNTAVDPVSATVNNSTGQVISAGIPTGSTGVYQVQIELPSNLPTTSAAQISIAQDAFVSNIVTIPVLATAGGTYAVPNPVPTGGSTTVYWTLSPSGNVEVHAGSATGPLLGSGGASGNAPISNVTDGEVLYLVDSANGTVLATTTLKVQQPTTSTTTLVANPNPIIVPVGSTYGRTTISWNVPSGSAGQQLHVNSPTGPIVGASLGAPGLVTTGNWVSNGMTFYLTDKDTGSVLKTLSVTVQAANGVITAAQNPVPLVAGSSYGQTSITWTAPSASATEIHLGSPSGPLFAAGTSTGSATTGAWVTDGLTLYLQDATNGNSTSAQNTLGTLTLHLQGSSGAGPTTLTLPNPVPLAAGSAFGKATVTWSAPGVPVVEVHIGSPTGPLFAASGSTGSQTTGAWISNGTSFYLVNASTHATLASATAVLAGTTALTLPNPITPVSGSPYGKATVSWNAPGVSAVEVHVSSPTGPLFATGGSTGSQTTGAWISNGMLLYLVDASTHATLATATAVVQ